MNALPLPPCALPPCPITALSASELSHAIHTQRLSCAEVMQAYLDRIDAINPSLNALVSLRHSADLKAEARLHDQLLAAGQSKGWLHGIPQAIKDLSPAAGIASTQGSPLLQHFVPTEDGLMAARMRAAGAILIGKTNVPEFGLGSHTFNSVFGATHNAFNPTKSAGGSSGGAAAALALHLLPVADGSDFMGSLRNPAAWNNVLGFRPSQGRVPMWPATDVWLSGLATEGPMARTTQDLARLLATQAGFDVRQPLSIQAPFDLTLALTPLPQQAIQKMRILWLDDLGGHLALEDGISDLCLASLDRASKQGVHIDLLHRSAKLGFSPERIWEAWLVWRKALVGARLAALMALPNAREKMKPEALYEYDSAHNLTGADFTHASSVRSGFYHSLLRLFEHYDALALPSAQVWPFDVTLRYPSEIKTASGSKAMDTYHRWMESSIYATFAGLPAISVPAGFGIHGAGDGLPMGLQLIGKPQGDAELLRLATLFTSAVRSTEQP